MFDDLKSYNAFLLVAALSCLFVWLARLFPVFAPALILLRYGVICYGLYELTAPAHRRWGFLLLAGLSFGWLGGDLDLVTLYAQYDRPSLWLFPARFILLPSFMLYVFATILRSYANPSS